MPDQKLMNRELSYDLLRIFAAIAVVFTHAGVDNTSGALFCESVFDIITRWAVPCFVMISGRFYLDPKREYNFYKLFASILRILVAVIFWNVLYQIYFYCIGYYDGLNFRGIIFSGALTGPYHFWYVWMIIALYAITPLLRTFCTNKRLMRYFIV